MLAALAATALAVMAGSTSAHADIATDAKVIAIVKNKLGSDEVYRLPDATTALNVGVFPAVATTGHVYTLIANVDDGKHLVAVLEDAGMNRVTWRFTLPPNAKIERQDDGTILIDTADSEQTETAVTQTLILNPWAKDVKGQVLPTSYQIVGNTIIQTVTTTGATYPVIVDPGITGFGYYGLTTPVVYVQFSKSETRSLASQAVIGAATAAGAACGEIPNKLAKVACGVVVAAKLGDFAENVTAAKDEGVCLKARVPVSTAEPGEAVNALDFYRKTC